MRVLLALALYAAVEITLLVLVGQAIGFLGLIGLLSCPRSSAPGPSSTRAGAR